MGQLQKGKGGSVSARGRGLEKPSQRGVKGRVSQSPQEVTHSFENKSDISSFFGDWTK